MQNIEVSIVVPVYNEEQNIDNFVNDVTSVFTKLNKSYEIIFVLDPSTDNTEKKNFKKYRKK